MKEDKGYTLVELLNSMGVLAIFFFVVLGVLGWGMNIYKLTKLDFEAPVKAEIVRAGGVVIFPVGMIVGWITFEEEEKTLGYIPYQNLNMGLDHHRHCLACSSELFLDTHSTSCGADPCGACARSGPRIFGRLSNANSIEIPGHLRWSGFLWST